MVLMPEMLEKTLDQIRSIQDIQNENHNYEGKAEEKIRRTIKRACNAED